MLADLFKGLNVVCTSFIATTNDIDIVITYDINDIAQIC